VTTFVSTDVDADDPPSLTGALDDLSLSELFELLTATNSTGVLDFGAPVGATLWVSDGRISYGTSPGSPTPRDLLVRQGIATESQFDGAVASTSATQALHDSLVDLFGVDAARIEAVAREQIITTVFEIVVVGADRFTFRTGGGDPLGAAVHLDHEAVITEAERRRAQWQRIAELIPSTAIVPALSPELPGGRAGMTITADEWQVLAKLDGHRTVADVISALGQSAFEVCGVLYELLRAGTACVVDESGEPSVA
jgi:hypothetical protein